MLVYMGIAYFLPDVKNNFNNMTASLLWVQSSFFLEYLSLWYLILSLICKPDHWISSPKVTVSGNLMSQPLQEVCFAHCMLNIYMHSDERRANGENRSSEFLKKINVLCICNYGCWDNIDWTFFGCINNSSNAAVNIPTIFQWNTWTHQSSHPFSV